MRDKGLATAVATLLAAFATAHLMQFGLSAGRAISGDPMQATHGDRHARGVAHGACAA